jgi:hypothetical protein
MSDFTNILNPGEQLAAAVTPDNKSSFALTDEDIAFINYVNMQTDMLKTMTIGVISHFESMMETQTKVLEHFKNQFFISLSVRHGVAGKPGFFSVDLDNKIFQHCDKKE